MEPGINKCLEDLLDYEKNEFACVFNEMKAYFLPISPLSVVLGRDICPCLIFPEWESHLAYTPSKILQKKKKEKKGMRQV